MKILMLAFALTCQSSAALALPCEGSRLAVTVAGWSITSLTVGEYFIIVDLKGAVDRLALATA